MSAIYDKIDQQGGEILPEDEQALMITREDLRDKLIGYNSYMGELNTNIEACKKEEDRIKAIRKTYENRLNLSKRNVLNAVQQFGTPTKTGGYMMEFPTFKFSTRRSESIVGDDKRLGYLYAELIRLIKELYSNGMLNPNFEYDLEGLCSTINANVKAEMEHNNDGDYYLPFTPTDLELIDIEIETSCNISSLFTKNNGIANVMACDDNAKSELSINKLIAKEYLKATEDVNVISCCHKEANYSLQMK